MRARRWADGHIARLALGETVQFRPRGHSMTGKIDDGQLCTVVPLGEYVLAVGDIVLCRVKGAQYLHLVKALQGVTTIEEVLRVTQEN